MQIQVPKVPESVVRIMYGDVRMDVIQGTQKSVDVPEGVEVKAVGLDVLGKPVGEPVVVVEASAPCDPPVEDEPEQPAQPESAQPESAQPESAQPETVINLESELSLGQSEPEIVSPFKGGVEKKGGPFKGPKAKGL